MMTTTDDLCPPEPITIRPTPENTPRPRPNSARSPRQTLPPEDPWANWQPDWREEKSPHRQQEQRNPTQSVSFRLSASREEERCQRRIVDARLWDAMTPHQQQAALEIAFSFQTMGRGLGYSASDWTRVPGASRGQNVCAAHGRLISTYIEWTKHCHREKLSHSMAIDVLVFGISCRTIDKDRRVRSGMARKNLIEGLSLYCILRGWPA